MSVTTTDSTYDHVKDMIHELLSAWTEQQAELTQLRALLELKTDQFLAEAELSAQLRADLAAAREKLDKGLLHKCNHCGIELSVSLALDDSGKSISPCSALSQLAAVTQERDKTRREVCELNDAIMAAHEDNKLMREVVDLTGSRAEAAEKERDRLTKEVTAFKGSNKEMHEMIMQVRTRFNAWDTPFSPVGQDIVNCIIRHADKELTTSRINFKEQVLEIINKNGDDKQCKCDREVNYVCDVCSTLEDIAKQIGELK